MTTAGLEVLVAFYLPCFGIRRNGRCSTMNLGLEKFPQQRYTPTTTSARATTLTHLAGDGRPIDSNPVHDFSVSHVKTITELVFGVHFRIPRQRIRVRVTGLNSGHAVCFTSEWCRGERTRRSSLTTTRGGRALRKNDATP